MILDKQPLTLEEVKEINENLEDSEKKTQVENYLKKFLKIKPEKAKKMKEELEKMDLLKIKKEHLIKMIDLMPEDISDLNKIFIDVNLNEDETDKILSLFKK